MVFRLSSVSKVNDANLSGKRFKAIRPEKEGFSPDVSALIMSAISRGMRDDPSLVCNLSLRSFFSPFSKERVRPNGQAMRKKNFLCASPQSNSH